MYVIVGCKVWCMYVGARGNLGVLTNQLCLQ